MARIFIFESGTTGWGGSFKSCFLIATALRKIGHCIVVSYLNESDYRYKLNAQDISVKRFYHRFYSQEIRNDFFNRVLRIIDKSVKKKFAFLSSFFDSVVHYKFIINVRRFIIENGIDLVHTNTNFIRDLEVFRIARKMNFPVVCHLRTDPSRQLTFSEKKMAEYKNVIFIAVSKSIMNKWIGVGLPKDKIKLIYNAQPPLLNLSKEIKNFDYELKKNTVHFLFVGRLSKIKGVDILVNALSGIDKKYWRLSILGDGPKEEFLKKLVDDNNLSQNIIFYGYQEEVKNFYASHDVLIVPSSRESFGRVIIEAMQFAIPVIASNIDGPSEIIKDGEDGILFESGNVEALRNSIDFLIKNPQKRIQIGKNGREKQKLFSEEVFMEKLLKVYDSLNIK